LTGRQLAKARRISADAEMQTYRHRVGARMRADCERADSRAAHDVYRAGLEGELSLLAFGLGQAGTSAAALELVAHRVSGLRAANDDRLYARFGG
jgi:hypothetical protein